METSFLNSEGDRTWVPGEWEALQTNAQPCRPHEKQASLFWVSVGYSLHVEGLWLLHGESNDTRQEETFQEPSSWTVVLKGRWTEDSCAMSPPWAISSTLRLPTTTHSRASQPVPARLWALPLGQQSKLEKSFRLLVPKREWHCLTLWVGATCVKVPLQAAPHLPKSLFSPQSSWASFLLLPLPEKVVLAFWLPGSTFSPWVGSSNGSVGKESTCNAGDMRDMDLITGLGRSPGGGHSNPLQYWCLGNPMDRGAWWAAVQRVVKNQTQLSN